MNITSEILLSTWLPFVVAALIQASFGLGVSMLTLLSGHALYKKQSHIRLLNLSTKYVVGAFFATYAILAGAVYLFSIENAVDQRLVWSVIVGVAAGVGVAITLFYYRHSGGTALWMPRNMAELLYKRTKKTKNSFEALLLGIGSIIAELIFIIAPILVAGILLAGEPSWAQLGGTILYASIATLPMIVLTVLIAGGHKVSRLQAWREKNKTFLQVTSGGALIVLAAYLFVYHVLGVTF